MNPSDTESTIATLKTYKKIATDPKKAEVLANDSTVIQFLALMLGNSNDVVVKGTLQILNIIMKDATDNTLKVLANTYGLIPALEQTIEKYEQTKASFSKDALELFTRLQFTKFGKPSAPLKDRKQNVTKTPTLSRKAMATKQTITKKNIARVFTLKIPGLGAKVNRTLVEQALLSIRGVVSLVFDLPKERFTIRIKPELELKRVTESIVKATEVYPYLIRKDKHGSEIAQLCGSPGKENVAMFPPYPPDDEDVTDAAGQKAAVSILGSVAAGANNWLSSASNFISKSLYW